MYMTQRKSGLRGDKVRKDTKASLNASLSNMTLNAEDSPTVRQRINEAKKSGFLDLRGLGLSMLPEGVADMDNLTVMMM
jgi:hypothetical protein